MYTTVKNLNMPENLLGMQISNFRYANMDFSTTPHIQIRFLGKDPVFKYEFLLLFIYPWNELPHLHSNECCRWQKKSFL